MDKIKPVDLKNQYLKIKDEVDSEILKVLESTSFINGPIVNTFRKNLENYLDVKYVIPCASGTDALQIALMALGLKPGDEVITSAFTFISAVEVIVLLGLTPVFADVDPKSFTIQPDEIEKKITENTKAILPVHVFGQGADMESIMHIADKYNLYIVEDTAQAIGAEYSFSAGRTEKLGTIGHIGTCSFFPTKSLGAYGDGGALFTNDGEHADKIRQIVNHGSTVKYFYDVIGVNSRLDSIQAAVLNVKLKYLDDYILAGQNAAAYYDKAFKEHHKIVIPWRDSKSTHVFHQYTVKLINIYRDDFIRYLNSKGIPAMIYYPLPLHLQNAYKFLGCKENDLPVTESLCKSVLSLPIHSEMNEEQLKYITETVLEYAGR